MPSIVLVLNAMVGFELVLQHTPLKYTDTPPSARIFPPQVADIIPIAVIEIVGARVVKDPCKPIILTHAEPTVPITLHPKDFAH